MCPAVLQHQQDVWYGVKHPLLGIMEVCRCAGGKSMYCSASILTSHLMLCNLGIGRVATTGTSAA